MPPGAEGAAAAATDGKGRACDAVGGEEKKKISDEEAEEDPSARQIRVALEALRARRAELREANAELDSLREQLLKAQGEAEAEREAKDFACSERHLLEKAKAAEAANSEVLKVQLDEARAAIDEERNTSKKLQAELEKERKARSSLSTDFQRLQSQLSSLGEGLKGMRSRLSATSTELEDTKKAKAELASEVRLLKSKLEEQVAKQAAIKDVEAELSTVRAEAASLQEKFREQQKAAESLQPQLDIAKEELARGREAGLLLLGAARANLEGKLQSVWHSFWQELDEVPHRARCTRPSALRPPKPRRQVPPDSTVNGTVTKPRIAFVEGEGLVSELSVTSFRDSGDLWFSQPEASVQCDRCENRGPQHLGRMQKVPGVSQFMMQEFYCSDCLRHEVLDNRRNEAMQAFLQPMSSPPLRNGRAGESSGSDDSYSSSSAADSSSSSADASRVQDLRRTRSDETNVAKKRVGDERGIRKSISVDELARKCKRRRG